MATVTMGSPSTDYVSKKTFYWTVGILLALVTVLLFAMTPNRDRTFSGTSDTGATLSQPVSSGTPGTAVDTNTNMNSTTGSMGTTGQDTMMGTSPGTTTDTGTTDTLSNTPGTGSNTTDLKTGVETR